MAAPASLEALPVHRSLRPGSALTTHVLLRIRAGAGDAQRARPKLTAVLVLDASSSMDGDPIQQVIRTAQRLTKLLSPDDRLAVVSFADGAHVVAPLQLLTDEARASISKAVGAIRANGQTNLSGGLAHAALLVPRRAEGEHQIVLVLSDGQPNVGATKKEELEEQARLVKGREIAISTLGYGAHHNESILSGIAEAAGGRYSFVADPVLAETSFVRALGAQLDVVAEGVSLVLTPHDGVEILRVLDGPRTSFSPRGLIVALPDLVVADELNVVVEIRVKAGREAGTQVLLEAALEGRVGGRSETFCVTAVASTLLSNGGGIEISVPAQTAVLLGECVERRAEARKLADRGAFGQAVEILQRIKQQVENAPGFVPDANEPLNDAVDTLIDEIALLSRGPQKADYERYKKASLDYADFGTSGAKRRGGTASPTTLSLQARAAELARGPRPNAALVGKVGPVAGGRWRVSDRMRVGRASTNEIVIVDFSITRYHAALEWDGQAHVILDMGSTNGVYVNQRKVDRYRLAHGDEIRVGVAVLRYEITPPLAPRIEKTTLRALLAQRAGLTSPWRSGSVGHPMLSISLRQLAAAAILAFAATACCGGASRKACTYDVNCTGGQVCRLDDAGGAFCSAKTGTAVGGSCDDRDDCDHGSCLKKVGDDNGVGICSMRCVTSNDCPVGFKTCLAISDSAGTSYCLPGAGNFRAPPSTKKKTGTTTAKPPATTAKPPGPPPTQVTPPGGRPPGPGTK